MNAKDEGTSPPPPPSAPPLELFELVEAEARRFAMTMAGQLLLVMAEQGISETELARELGVTIRTLRGYLRGENWRRYLPLAAICLALNVRIETRLPDRETRQWKG
jgi:DNA-binding Xre family transcriptional regulator